MKGKYPRTPHLPGSGASNDDKWASPETLDFLASGIELIVSEKMDGGNITMEHDHIHARSTDSVMGPWENPTKALWASIRGDIPEGFSVSGESMYARHSIGYEGLPGPFLVFGVWNAETALSWSEVEEWAELLGLPTVPVLYRGTDYAQALGAWRTMRTPDTSEGFVLRNANRFEYEDFGSNVVKFVRIGHIQTTDAWRARDDFTTNSFL